MLRGMTFILLAWAVSTAWALDSAPEEWRAKMRELSKALSEAVPLLDPDPTRDVKALTSKIKEIHEISKQLDGKFAHAAQVPDADPALAYIAGLLKSDLERAYASLEKGHTEYAKSVIRNSVSYCVACHTRTQTGKQFPMLSALNEPMKKASWIEKIEYEAATRQFDSVIAEVMKRFEDPAVPGTNSLDLERASRVALSIAVRVKQDPERARFLAEAVSKSASATPYLKTAALAWKKDIADWQSEPRKPLDSEKALLAAARKLIDTGSTEETLVRPNSEVKLLRASVYMHDLLRRFPESPQTAEALFLIGLSYDTLQELGLWSMHEMYYHACILKSPHTKLAEKCYQKYEDSVTMGYTGSAGTNVPKAVREHLGRLKALAGFNGKRAGP